MKKPEGAALVIGDGNLPCQLATIRKKCPTEEKNGQMKLLVPLKLGKQVGFWKKFLSARVSAIIKQKY